MFLTDPIFQSLPAMLRYTAAAALAGAGWWRACRDGLAFTLSVIMPRVILAVMGAVLLAWALAMLAVCG